MPPTPTFRLQEEAWRLRAACRGRDVNLWFAAWRGQEEEGGAPHLLQGRLICIECPVWRDCAEYALRSHTKDGIWGGMNERQRRDWRRAGKPNTMPAMERRKRSAS